MRDPGRQFGLIQILRPADRAGKPFELGDRFQGRYNVPAALQRALTVACSNGATLVGEELGRLLESERLQRWLHRIGDVVFSDFGMIDLLELDSPRPEWSQAARDGREASDAAERYRFRYRYIEGSPIAGASTILIEPLPGGGGCRLTQVFEYQELRVDVAVAFVLYGLKLHNEVLYSQAEASAARIGARILDTNILTE